MRPMTALQEANLRRYYDQRAPEYEQIYLPRDEQHGRELGELSRELRQALRGRRVLEVACGTGYWTACAARVALRLTATNASLPMLAEAREKRLPPNVELLPRDAYDLAGLPGGLDGGSLCVSICFSGEPTAATARTPNSLPARRRASFAVGGECGPSRSSVVWPSR